MVSCGEIEHHLAHCVRCSVLLDSTRKMLLISGNERTFEVSYRLL